MRKEVTDLLLRDFGYDLDKAVKKVETTFGGRPYEELSPDEKVRYEKLMNPFLPAPITQVSLNATRRALLPYSALLVLLKESAMIFNQNDPKRTSDYQKRKYGL